MSNTNPSKKAQNAESEEDESAKKGGFFRFIFSRFFLMNLLIAGLLTILVGFIALRSLQGYTDHNKYITVPDLRGMSLEQASQMLERKALRLNIADSLYEPRELPYTILGQFPGFGQEVKKDRVVHLTVNKTKPQMVDVPVDEALNKTLRSVQFNLQGKGFRIGELIYQSGVYDNQVLSLRKHGEKSSLKQGDKLPKGSLIDLVVTDGYGNTRVSLPDLTGMTISEARFMLRANNLVEGNFVFENGVDSLVGKVSKQEPSPDSDPFVKAGSMINIWLSDQLGKDGDRNSLGSSVDSLDNSSDDSFINPSIDGLDQNQDN
ncbi:MAG: beta-lactam-binding protein with PASTA domain [Limisphaerales bacterium]|jgi:beta-lactam-binding protein with PASTA domain